MRSEIIFSSLSEIAQHLLNQDLILVIDQEVKKSWPQLFEQINSESVYVLEGGEAAKSFKNFEKCSEFFLAGNIHRKTHLLAIGGGATSDFAGFVAGTLLRGLSWSVIPTTLLAMIDAAIGGKTAINSKYGKNLIGVFHLPSKIFIMPDFLKTLDHSHYQSGLGEMVKYVFLDSEVAKFVKEKRPVDELIVACARYKEAVISRDLLESGERKHLNFGHTLGHALEKAYQLTHGEAVFWGCYLILKLYQEDLIPLFEKSAANLEVAYKNPPWKGQQLKLDQIESYLQKDKKKVDQKNIDIVLSLGAGKPYMKTTTFNEIMQLLREKKNEIEQYHL